MKLSALHQSYLNRRNRSPASLDSSCESSGKSIFWLIFHCLCCLISLILGFRFSRLVFFSTSSINLYSDLPLKNLTLNRNLNLSPETTTTNSISSSSSRVVVGRHGIRIRPYPHPNPVEVMKAHKIISRVQKEQKMNFGRKENKLIIAITPTYVRTFQELHLSGVMHSLMLVPYDLIWIVVEAGGVSNETSLILAKSGIKIIHVGFDRNMPNTWEDRSKVEIFMRLQGLRVVKEEKLDGIVIFADDSNMHSMEFFDEIQNVNWVGAISVGILAHSGNALDMVSIGKEIEEEKEEERLSLPVQGPACNSTDKLIGWHIFDTLPYAGKSAVYIDDVGAVLPRKLEWCGFVLNSRLLWENENKPKWVKEFGLLVNENEDVLESPLGLLNDVSMVEPLGSCGKQVLLWWLRVEARADSKFPPGWIIDPPLEITVAAKQTPWLDIPPEPPTKKKDQTPFSQSKTVLVIPKQQQQHSTKIRKSKRRSKRNKHEPKPTDTTTQAYSSSLSKHQERI